MLVLRFPPRWLARVVLLSLLLLLLVPAFALAVTTGPTLVLPGKQLWAVLIGAIVPLVTYVLNSLHTLGEPVKAFVLVLATTLATALYTALATNVIGWNSATLELIVSGIAGALAAHKLLWQPSGVADLLRARNPHPATRRQRK